MKKLKKDVAKVIQKSTKQMALIACGSASHFGGYQTKEPKSIIKK